MALGDPLGLQDDPEKAAPEIPDYLGKESPLAFKGQPALPVTGAAAFGSPSAPAGPGGPGPMPDGMTSQMSGGTQGGFAQLASKLMDSDLFKFGGGGDLGTRGDTGGVSLSDHLRDLESGAPNPSSSFPIGDPSSQVSGGELALGAEAGGAAAGMAGDLAAGGYEGLLEAFQGGGWAGLMDQFPGFGGLDPFSSYAILGSIKSLWDPDNAFSLPFSNKDRGESVAHEIKTQMKDLPEIMRQLKAGAVDPTTLRGMDEEGLAGLFSEARTAYGSTSGLAPMFGVSGRKEAGQQHLDMSSLADPIRKMEELDFFNMIAAQDLLDQRGHQWQTDTEGPDYDYGKHRFEFGNAIHALTGQGGLPEYGGFTALAPWDPSYAKESVVPETRWDPEAGGTGGYVEGRRAANDPAEYLAAIGADPKLAEQLGPMIEGAQPGKYLETLNQIFGLLNPNAADSTFGRLFATQQGDPGGVGDVAAASGAGGFGDVAGAIFAPGQPPPFDPSNAGQAGLAGGEEFAEEQLTT